MNRFWPSQFNVRHNLIMMIGVLLCVYFTYHVVQGNRSIPRLLALESMIERLTEEHASLVARRKKLETKVAMLRPGSVNPDFLEERVRLTLGYTLSEEVVITDM